MMDGPNPLKLSGFLLAVIVVMCGYALMKGGLYLGIHEIDAIHLIELGLLTADGSVPHLDFMTPLGILAYAPIAVLIDAGFQAGAAFLLSQGMVALMLLPAVVRVGTSRLSPVVAYLFGAVVMILCLALIFGGTEESVSISMSYNRWSWAIAFVAIALALIPPRGASRQGLDGAIIGLAMAALALCKATYFLAFIVPVAVGLLARGAYRTFGMAAVAGLGVAVVVTLVFGPDYWLAYIRDLALVSMSEIRPKPGGGLGSVLTAPSYIASTALLLVAIVLLRQGARKAAGLSLLLLAPGFVYVTYQNFGNDPQWLALLGVLLFALRPEAGAHESFGRDVHAAVGTTALVALVLSTPSYANMLLSPLRHSSAKPEEYAPLTSAPERYADLHVAKNRANQIDVTRAMEDDTPLTAEWGDAPERDDTGTIMGEPVEYCEVDFGFAAWMNGIAVALEASGLAEGKRILFADFPGNLWMYGNSLPLEHSSPWYYGGLPGYQSADYLVVPFCAMTPKASKLMRDALLEHSDDLEEVERTPLYVVFGKVAGSEPEERREQEVEREGAAEG